MSASQSLSGAKRTWLGRVENDVPDSKALDRNDVNDSDRDLQPSAHCGVSALTPCDAVLWSSRRLLWSAFSSRSPWAGGHR